MAGRPATGAGGLSGFLAPGLREAERAVARVEGWIFGVAWELALLFGHPDDDREVSWAVH